MLTPKIQFIIIFIILGAIIIWSIYALIRKKPITMASCSGCDLAEMCKKKELRERGHRAPTSCEDCPSSETCDKKETFLSCGGPSEE